MSGSSRTSGCSPFHVIRRAQSRTNDTQFSSTPLAAPLAFQRRPAPFHRIVFAVIRRIKNQVNRQPRPVRKLDHPFQAISCCHHPEGCANSQVGCIWTSHFGRRGLRVILFWNSVNSFLATLTPVSNTLASIRTIARSLSSTRNHPHP